VLAPEPTVTGCSRCLSQISYFSILTIVALGRYTALQLIPGMGRGAKARDCQPHLGRPFCAPQGA
jgi:hypothetical protein